METLTPLISVITPTFNHQAFIGPCVESVLSQSYRHWEQIILDDGSTDDTPEIVQRYDDKRIVYIRQQNKGLELLPHTYNIALNACKGELIAILEGDDVWPADKLQILAPSFNDPNQVLAYGAVGDLSSQGAWSGRLSRSVRKRMNLRNEILTNTPIGAATPYMLTAEGVDLVPPSTAIIRRSALEAIGGFQYFPGLCVTDLPTFAMLSLTGKFYYTKAVVGFRRRHLGSATFNNLNVIVSHARSYVEQFLDHHDLRLSSEQRAEILNTWNRPRPTFELMAGRLKLLSGDWISARYHFSRVFNGPLSYVCLAAILGWCSSWFRCDIERLLALTGVASVKEPSVEKAVN